MVARLQHVGNGQALPFGGFGVLRVFQQAVGKAFLFGRGLVAQNLGQQAHGGIKHRLGGNFAAGQDKIAQGYLFNLMMIDHALVDAFEAPADHRHSITGGKAVGHGLVKGAAAR